MACSSSEHFSVSSSEQFSHSLPAFSLPCELTSVVAFLLRNDIRTGPDRTLTFDGLLPVPSSGQESALHVKTELTKSCARTGWLSSNSCSWTWSMAWATLCCEYLLHSQEQVRLDVCPMIRVVTPWKTHVKSLRPFSWYRRPRFGPRRRL